MHETCTADESYFEELLKFSSLDYKITDLSKYSEGNSDLDGSNQLIEHADHAIAYYEQEYLEKSQDVKSLFHLANLHLLVGNHSKSLRSYYRLVNNDRSFLQRIDVIFGMGICYFTLGKTDKSRQYLLKVYEREGDKFARAGYLHYMLGVIFQSSKDYDQALKHLNAALDNPKPSCIKSNIQLHMGLCHQAMLNIDVCEEIYKSLLVDDNCESSVKATASYNLGLLYFEQHEKSISTTIDVFLTSISYDPNNYRVHYLLGRCYVKKGEDLKAVQSYEKSLEIKATDPTVWCCLGVLQHKLKRNDEAIKCYVRALEIDLNHAESWLNLGCLYSSVKQVQDAIKCYQKAKEDPYTKSTAIDYINMLQKIDNTSQRIHSLPDLDYFFNGNSVIFRSLEEYQDTLHSDSIDTTAEDSAFIKSPNSSKSLIDSDNENSYDNLLDTKYSKLLLPAPVIEIDNAEEAYSSKLEEWCLSPENPITIIRGIAKAVDMNLDLFSSKSLANHSADDRIEVRSQRQQTSDENWDSRCRKRIWLCESNRAYTTIAKYARYQASSVRESLHNDESPAESPCSDTSSNSGQSSSRGTKRKKPANPHKIVKFGTNVDLSNQQKWKTQLKEMDKLPQFLKVTSRQNLLTYLGYEILGMNSVQLYMKVPGCRTPGHQENNNLCSININVGPGNCEWFGVHVHHWKSIEMLCKKNKVDFLTGSWWPVPDELCALNIPLYRFIQKPGDVVFVNVGTVHWVQSLGWCNNIAWNVGPITANQYRWAMDRYICNKLEQFHSIVPMILLSWNIAKHIKIKDKGLHEEIRSVIFQSMQDCNETLAELEMSKTKIKWHEYLENEPAPYCYQCKSEVFNILFVTVDKPSLVYCKKCAQTDNSRQFSSFVVLQQFKMEELQGIYHNFVNII